MIKFDLTAFGDKELERAMRKLPAAIQDKVMLSAQKKSRERLLPHIISALSGGVVMPMTGALLAYFSVKPKSFVRRGDWGNTVAFKMPTRAEVNIPADATYYYPRHVEYGHAKGKGKAAAPPHPFLRPSVDKNRTAEVSQIAADLKKGALRQWKKLKKGKR